MRGEPQDKEGACNARLFIADNYGDGTATIQCQLSHGHEGLHQEQFERQGHLVTITWAIDEREKCDHGCGQWAHDHRSPQGASTIQCPRDTDDHEFSDCAFCFPGRPPQTCGYCGKTHYYEEGHLLHCTQKPFTCAHCGERGFGKHTWLSCPKFRDTPSARKEPAASSGESGKPAQKAEGTEWHVARYDALIVISSPYGVVTIDLKKRGYGPGIDHPGKLLSETKYRGRAWLERLCHDAAWWLESVARRPTRAHIIEQAAHAAVKLGERRGNFARPAKPSARSTTRSA